MNTGSAAYYYHYDPIGSAVNLTSSTGATEWTDSYEPYGTVHSETKNDTKAPANVMKFDGQYLDATGLYFLRARLYDPATGRFSAPDPLPSTPTDPYTSSYAYAIDQPTTLSDPTGLHAGTCGSPLCFTNDTFIGKCLTGIGEGLVLTSISVGTLGPEAAGQAAVGCATGAGEHALNKVNPDLGNGVDAAVTTHEVLDTAGKRAARLAAERAAAKEASTGITHLIIVIVPVP